MSTNEQLFAPVAAELDRRASAMVELQRTVELLEQGLSLSNAERDAALVRIVDLERELADCRATHPDPPRDWLTRPYGDEHYWNIPLGEDARMVPLNMGRPDVVRAEWDVIIATPDAPLQPVYINTVEWGNNDRCSGATATVLAKDGWPAALPITEFPMLGNWNRDNQSACIIARDRDGVLRRWETQPFVFCGGKAYSLRTRPSYMGGRIDDQAGMPSESADGRGIEDPGVGGAHGGSGIEAFGGTITVADLEAGEILHATKCVINTAMYLTAVDRQRCRWPATRVDKPGGDNKYGTAAPAGYVAPDGMRMGARLALPVDFPVDQLTTGKGAMIARSLRRFGTFVVDGAQGHHAFYLAMEQGPRGCAPRMFFGDSGKATSGPLYDDLVTMVRALHLVDDDHLASIGGAGKRRA